MFLYDTQSPLKAFFVAAKLHRSALPSLAGKRGEEVLAGWDEHSDFRLDIKLGQSVTHRVLSTWQASHVMVLPYVAWRSVDTLEAHGDPVFFKDYLPQTASSSRAGRPRSGPVPKDMVAGLLQEHAWAAQYLTRASVPTAKEESTSPEVAVPEEEKRMPLFWSRLGRLCKSEQSPALLTKLCLSCGTSAPCSSLANGRC